LDELLTQIKQDDQLGLALIAVDNYSLKLPAIATLEVKSLSNSKSYKLQNVHTNLNWSALFIGTLPVGEYEPLSLTSSSALARIEPQTKIGTFKIETGKIADLGLIKIARNSHRFLLLGRTQLFESALSRLNNESRTRLLDHMKFGDTWTSKTTSIIDTQIFKHPFGLGELTELEDGTILSAGYYGRLLKRDANGRWKEALNTGSMSGLSAIFANKIDDEIAIIGDMDGQVYKVKVDYTWQKVTTQGLPLGAIKFIHASPSRQDWFIGLSIDNKVELHKSTTLEGPWTLVRSDDVSISFKEGERKGYFWSTSEYIGFASTSSRSLLCFDFISKIWTENNTPKSQMINALDASSAHENIGVLTSKMGGVKGIFATEYQTNDCGATWTEIKMPQKIKVSPPIAGTQGRMYAYGGSSKKMALFLSENVGKSWSLLQSRDLSNLRFWQTNQGFFHIIENDVSDEIWHSTDGIQWDLEMSALSN
jgi:hypothetical protein